MQNNKMLADNIKHLRLALGKTQTDLALAIGVKAVTVSGWETARNYPSLKDRKKLADYFGKTVEELDSVDFSRLPKDSLNFEVNVSDAFAIFELTPIINSTIDDQWFERAYKLHIETKDLIEKSIMGIPTVPDVETVIRSNLAIIDGLYIESYKRNNNIAAVINKIWLIMFSYDVTVGVFLHGISIDFEIIKQKKLSDFVIDPVDVAYNRNSFLQETGLTRREIKKIKRELYDAFVDCCKIINEAHGYSEELDSIIAASYLFELQSNSALTRQSSNKFGREMVSFLVKIGNKYAIALNDRINKCINMRKDN